MGRIADAALVLLADGPRHPRDLGAVLARDGVTRARDPGAAVRRALRDDRRFVDLEDGRVASIAQALSGVALGIVVSPQDAAAGRVDIDPDLTPLGVLGIGPALPLPEGVRGGQALVARVVDPADRRIVIEPVEGLVERPRDEAALAGAIMRRLTRPGSGLDPLVIPPVTALAPAMLTLLATDPAAFRRPGRPLSMVLAGAGLETHLGWVGREGTAWESLTEVEAEVLELEVADLLYGERVPEAAHRQEQLVGLVERHLPERRGAARRRWALILSRAGRPDDALDALRPLLHDGDPEDRYVAAQVALAAGDVPLARRMAEEGLAHSDDPRSVTALCLADLAGDLDAQAAFRRLADRGAGDGDWTGFPMRTARALLRLGRSYLIEAAVEGIVEAVGRRDVAVLLEALGSEAGQEGREACVAFAAVLPPDLATAAWRAAAGVQVSHPGVAGLLEARPSAAWATSPEDAPDQQQLIIAVRKEEDRVGPLVVLVDFDDLGGAVKDAFFLPDMIEARLRREVFERMEDTGIPPFPVDVEDAVDLLQAGLSAAEEIGWTLPSLAQQPVLDRIDRLVFGRSSAPGSA